MTAVDHAELKRADMKPEDVLAVLRADRLPECSFDSGRTWEVDGVIVAETFTRCADLIDALLSEIEGLKAALKKSNDGFEEYERKFYLAVDDVDRLKLAICGGEDAPGAINAVSVEDCQRFIAEERSFHSWAHEECGKLQAVLALRPQTAESGK